MGPSMPMSGTQVNNHVDKARFSAPKPAETSFAVTHIGRAGRKHGLQKGYMPIADG